MPLARGVGGCHIFYEVVGEEGPPVVLLQGLGLSSRFWFGQPDLVAHERGHPRRVVLVDNRGVGRSDRPLGPYTTAQLADDAVAVMDQVGLEAAHVVGISLGGMIAQQVALRQPRRVTGLVLMATTPGLPHGQLPRPGMLWELSTMPLRRSPRSLRKSLVRVLLSPTHAPQARRLLMGWGAALRADPVPPVSFFSQLAGAVTHSTGSRLGEIACPTVVVTGSADEVIPPANSQVLARLIPGAVLEELPDVGHGIPMVDDDVVCRALRRIDGGAAAARPTPVA